MFWNFSISLLINVLIRSSLGESLVVFEKLVVSGGVLLLLFELEGGGWLVSVDCRAWLDFVVDSLNFEVDRLDFVVDSLGFVVDRLDFVVDSLGFVIDRLDFVVDTLDFVVNPLGLVAACVGLSLVLGDDFIMSEWNGSCFNKWRLVLLGSVMVGLVKIGDNAWSSDSLMSVKIIVKYSD